MRLGIVLIFLIHIQWCYAQLSDSTIMLSGIRVYGVPEQRFLIGASVNGIDSTLGRTLTSQHLGEILSVEFPIAFRNYGNGMVSGISLRGTSPQHTAVLWNGININSFSLGQADFSILPMTAADEVKVVSGGGSARFGSGAIGGTVLLRSDMDDDVPLRATVEIGSFGKYFGSVQGMWQKQQWKFRTRIYHQQCENDFPVGSKGLEQEHAAFQQKGFQQDIGFQVTGSKLIELHYWYHKSDREVQANAGGANSDDEQQDENHRLSIQYKGNGLNGAVIATTGYVRDNIVFNKTPGVVERWIADAKYQRELPFNIGAEIGASANYIMGKLEAYGRDRSEERYDLIASFSRNIGRRLSLAMNFRQPFVTGFSAPFLPYFGANYWIFNHPGNALLLRGNVSRNYRVPTLNDRYWPDVGNLNLLPETSTAAELGLRWIVGTITIEQVGFVQQIDQMIKWAIREDDDEGFEYYPDNIIAVAIRGMESRVGWEKKFTDWRFAITANYQFVRSVTTDAPKSLGHTINAQLMYTPKHVLSMHGKVTYRQWSFLAWQQSNSKRYTETSQSDMYALPPFNIVNCSISRSFNMKQSSFVAQMSVRNIFDEKYTMYELRAMPGRHYNFQINYKLNRKQNEL